MMIAMTTVMDRYNDRYDRGGYRNVDYRYNDRGYRKDNGNHYGHYKNKNHWNNWKN